MENTMPWILLFGAIAAEVVATSTLKLTNGLTRLGPTV
jgi:multidrug transporter EmrE-like cation transporter